MSATRAPHQEQETTETALLRPLRRVVSVTVSQESGTALGPHYFWLTRRYTGILECGHEVARYSCNFGALPAAQVLPKRIRCVACPGVERRGRARPVASPPKYDPVGDALLQALLQLDRDSQDVLLRFEGAVTHLSDDRARASVHAAVALAWVDHVLATESVVHAEGMRTALKQWRDDPREETLQGVRRAVRRVYGAQRQTRRRSRASWYSCRSLIAIGSITAGGTRAAGSVIAATTWNRDTREEFYSDLWALRARLDAARGEVDSAVLRADADAATAHTLEVTRLTQDLAATFAQSDTLEAAHLPSLRFLFEAYLTARETVTANGPNRT